ncbi:AT-rich interactive domain-containing protein 4B-like isoform X2 [Daktulosphaira vitifoliae]|uniref:AT-rich interactive domain-containing protein 4B-like isoform X2 n=1 Tax=Daktulosphaira vitifoliae TaxID=58002 RepID=UPI0021A99115|nr:AT-rich interactive domain-containing protein 4B-like isoform X2 [Daktulosphaira vitifoliae]
MVHLDEPPFLTVGTEVSAKYKGAFCEAKIRKISKSVKCKVQYTNGLVAIVPDELIKGQIKIGANIEIKCNDKKELLEGTIQKIQDHSQYTVVFDDGDITSLKRSALCLKSGKHFAASATLDQLPLTHPEHIGTPTRNSIVYGRRSRKHIKSVGESEEEENIEMEEKDIGKVVCVEANDKKKIRDNWFPGLVVAPTAQSAVKTNVLEDYLVRSFKDGKYYTVPKKEITEFTKEIAAKVENPTLKTAVEKAILYLDKDELPPHWDRDLLFGIEKNCITTDSEGASDSDNSDEESIEEKDHFVAQLFKFMDDRGTPLNQAPMINEKDVDLYKLFKVVNNLGGFNKVGKCKQWKTVAQKIGHEQSVFSVKQAYQQYLHSFEDFYRKLGCTMLSHPRGVRSRSRFSRSIIRDVDKALPGTSLSSAEKNKQFSSYVKIESNEKKDKDKDEVIKEVDASKEILISKKSLKIFKADEKVTTLKNDDITKKIEKKKDKPEVVLKDSEVSKEGVTLKKSCKLLKTDEKIASIKTNEESGKKLDKKKEKTEFPIKDLETLKEFGISKKSCKMIKVEDVNNSRPKTSTKWDTEIEDLKESPKDIKVKKEVKETTTQKDIKKEEENIEILDLNEDESETSEDKKSEKKKYSRNLFGKSIRRNSKKEKVERIKPTETGLSGVRKMRSIKEQIKTFVKGMTPSFKKPKRGASTSQSDSTSQSKQDDEFPKVTRSKSKDELPPRLRKLSVLNNETQRIQLPVLSCASPSENLNKIKKSDEGLEKRKNIKKKKDDKDDKTLSTESNIQPMNSEIDSCDKDTPIAVGDDLVVYYGDKHATTYDAKVLNVCDIEGAKKFYVHYKGWNSRYDEWIDVTRIALLKSKILEPELDLDPDGDDGTKSDYKGSDMKKLPPINNRTRRSVTPSMPYSSRKKSPFSNVRPTRTCTLNDRPLSSIGKYTLRDNSDSESEYSGNLGLAKQYNKRNLQPPKLSRPDFDDSIKLETSETVNQKVSPDSDTQKKSPYPKTYPGKEELLQRSAPRIPKSCVFKVHSNKSEEIEICEQVTLKPPFEYNYEMSQSMKNKNKEEDDDENENDDDVNENDEDNDISIDNDGTSKIETKSAVIHYLSPKEKSEKNDCQHLPEISNAKEYNFALKSNMQYYSSSSEDEQIQLKNKIMEDEKISSIKKLEDFKKSGTDFDLNKIRSEMKGIGYIPSSSNMNVENAINSDPPELKAEVDRNPDDLDEPEDIYEFKDSESSDFIVMPSVIEEKNRRIIKHNEPPKLYSYDKSVEISNMPELTPKMEILEKNNDYVTPFQSVIYPALPFKDKVGLDFNKKEDEMVDHSSSQSCNETSEFEKLNPSVISQSIEKQTSSVKLNTESYPVNIEESHKTDEVLDLCIKPIDNSNNNIFSTRESNETDDTVEEDDDEDEDDDDSKLVIAENDKIEADCHTESDLVVIDEEQNSSSEPTNRFKVSNSMQDTDIESKSSDETRRSASLKHDEHDDESTTSCNENIQDTLVHSFQVYTNTDHNQSSKTSTYQLPSNYQSYTDNYDSTKSGFDIEETSTKSSTTESAKDSIFNISDEITAFKDKYSGISNDERIKTENQPVNLTGLQELQCREEIVDEETLNNAIENNYSRNTDYNVYKPSTSKSFFNVISNPNTVNRENFLETKSSSDEKSNFFEKRETCLQKNNSYEVINNVSGKNTSYVFDNNTPSSNSKDSMYEISTPSTSKDNFYNNSIPSSSKNLSNLDTDVNNVLFCEETIPGSPTGTPDEHSDDQDERKKSFFEEREAASAMFAMNLAFRKSTIASREAKDNSSQSLEYNIHQRDENIDQRHLQFLAEVSSRDEGAYFNKSAISEPIDEQVAKLEKPQIKRKISSNENSIGKRNKIQYSASESENERYDHNKVQIPTKDGKPLVIFTPEMDSAQRQAVILSKINELRKDYILVKARIVVVDRRRKKIRKRKREMAKLNSTNSNKRLPENSTNK